jgi:uncharacterized protein (DUF1778 family)
MPATGAKPDKTRSQNINLRVTRSQKALIDRAASCPCAAIAPISC